MSDLVIGIGTSACAVRGPVLRLQQAQQHCEPADGIASSDDDVVVLRLAQHVDCLAQELELEPGVALEQLGQCIETSSWYARTGVSVWTVLT